MRTVRKRVGLQSAYKDVMEDGRWEMEVQKLSRFTIAVFRYSMHSRECWEIRSFEDHFCQCGFAGLLCHGATGRRTFLILFRQTDDVFLSWTVQKHGKGSDQYEYIQIRGVPSQEEEDEPKNPDTL